MRLQCVYSLTSPTIIYACGILGWHRTMPNFPIPGYALLAYSYAFVSPIFEEMIVRAFFMTEIFTLTQSSRLAILVSVLLQTSYHFYHGIPYALSAGVMFVILSIFTHARGATGAHDLGLLRHFFPFIARTLLTLSHITGRYRRRSVCSAHIKLECPCGRSAGLASPPVLLKILLAFLDLLHRLINGLHGALAMPTLVGSGSLQF